MTNEFHKGDKVKWSAEGRRTVGRRYPDRRGVVCREPHSQTFISVRWNGNSSSTTYNANFLEPDKEPH
jgi:hypothetical protein